MDGVCKLIRATGTFDEAWIFRRACTKFNESCPSYINVGTSKATRQSLERHSIILSSACWESMQNIQCVSKPVELFTNLVALRDLPPGANSGWQHWESMIGKA